MSKGSDKLAAALRGDFSDLKPEEPVVHLYLNMDNLRSAIVYSRNPKDYHRSKLFFDAVYRHMIDGYREFRYKHLEKLGADPVRITEDTVRPRGLSDTGERYYLDYENRTVLKIVVIDGKLIRIVKGWKFNSERDEDSGNGKQ